MPTNPLYVFSELPTTSAAAIREFNDRYLAAVGASRPTGWADTHGDLVPTSSPMVTFPIGQLRTLYQQTNGNAQRFKTLREKSFDVKTVEYDDGYSAALSDIFLKEFAYRNWQQAPSRLVLAEEQFRHTQVAALLAAGTATTCVDGVNFFSSAHPVNMTDSTVKMVGTGATTWSNYQSTATNPLGLNATGYGSGGSEPGIRDLTALEQEVTAMQVSVPDENGQLLSADPDTLAVTAPYYEPLKNMLARDLILETAPAGSAPTAGAATNNFYKTKFNVIPIKELPFQTGQTADWYLIDSKMVKQGIAPWVSLRQTMPASLSLRVYDESSDYFKDTGRIKLSSHIWYGFSLALPHAIRRIKGPTF